MSNNYENLDVWRRSIKLASLIYVVSKKFPPEELYGLSSQIRRAVVSVSSNIAEGSARGSKKDFIRFVSMALGSLSEVESQICVAYELHYLSESDFKKVSNELKEVGNLLGGFRKYLHSTV
ncbi:MAG: four helix bundle protein [Parcubacteria group bacterium]|nr:four helix bundle protein [Parcubacteria group bacterium]